MKYLRIYSLSRYFLLFEVSNINDITTNFQNKNSKLAKIYKYFNQVIRFWQKIILLEVNSDFIKLITI